jgi:hypothetical protein
MSPEAMGRGMKLTPYHALEPMVRMSGGIPPSPYVMSQFLTEYKVKVNFRTGNVPRSLCKLIL